MADQILIGNVTLANLLIFIFIFIITLFISNITYSLIRRFFDNKITLRNSKLIARIVEYAIFLIGFYIGIHDILQYDLNALVASLGIISIAMAFASQQIIQNFLASILISIGRPIQIDDWVEIGESGISNVRDITLTRTVLRDRKGRVLSIPNSVLMSSTIVNYTKSGFIEVNIPLTIPYSNFEKICKLIKEVANEHKKILPNVSGEEKDMMTRLFELAAIKMLFRNKLNLSLFEPKILISDISDDKALISVRLWLRDIEKKDEIISELLEGLLRKLRDEKLISNDLTNFPRS